MEPVKNFLSMDCHLRRRHNIIDSIRERGYNLYYIRPRADNRIQAAAVTENLVKYNFIYSNLFNKLDRYDAG